MRPRPPSAIRASAVESSPERTTKSSGSAVIRRAILPKFGDASFKPTTRGISGRPARHEEVDPLIDLPLDERRQGAKIDPTLFVERSHERGSAALPVHAIHGSS